MVVGAKPGDRLYAVNRQRKALYFSQAAGRRARSVRGKAAMIDLRRILIGAVALGFALAGRAFAFPEPTNLNPPTYDYTEPDGCPTCHFILGLDHTSDAAGVQWDSSLNMWLRTGHGWFDSAHAQSDYGSTENTFCTKCHAPMQAAPESSFNQGQLINTQPVAQSSFQAVTCNSCHPPDTLEGAILKANPTAVLNGDLALYIWGSDPNQVSSYIPILQGQEDTLCLSCHEQRHNTDNPAFQAMYAAGVLCVNCHMAPHGYVTYKGVTIPEYFHDWKVAENLPYSCGAQGSLSGFSCHSEFTTQSTLALIPYMKEQHSEWWNLPPFNTAGNTAPPLNTASDYVSLWRSIQIQQQTQARPDRAKQKQ
jgi:hypothetical protein